MEIEYLKKQNEQLQQGSAACRKVMQELRDNITILSNANDVQTTELDKFRQMQRDEQAARLWKQSCERSTKRAVLNAFGWKQSTANPTLLRAACGFWKAQQSVWSVVMAGLVLIEEWICG